ncbi:DUF4252 domain-containing protein [Congregibacter variabilis]|uniref:DUF4252 domain-containing protein n=1 Tax=Congregibacter variabilis TaxID=3081200 RepID=A0ABZ0I1U9_9GAMM|nr:DUF4252 domain-containing protein [Congregibacter sp. IMCC43200]
MKTLTLLLVATLLAGCGVTASSRNPGYVQFDAPKYEGLKNDTSISLGPRLLHFAARHTDDDPQTKALLQSLEGVRVSVYQVPPSVDHEALRDEVGIATAKAFDEHWSPIVRVVEDDSRVHIFVKEQDGLLLGIAVVSVDHEELVFVNVMGEMAAENLTALSSVVPGTDTLALSTVSAE